MRLPVWLRASRIGVERALGSRAYSAQLSYLPGPRKVAVATMVSRHGCCSSEQQEGRARASTANVGEPEAGHAHAHAAAVLTSGSRGPTLGTRPRPGPRDKGPLGRRRTAPSSGPSTGRRETPWRGALPRWPASGTRRSARARPPGRGRASSAATWPPFRSAVSIRGRTGAHTTVCAAQRGMYCAEGPPRVGARVRRGGARVIKTTGLARAPRHRKEWRHGSLPHPASLLM